MADDIFLKPATDSYRNQLIEESRFGWKTLLIGIFLYIAWVLFAEPSFSLAMIGLALMWVMRLLHEMRKNQCILAATLDLVFLRITKH